MGTINTEQGLKILKEEGLFWTRLGFSFDPPEFDEEGNSILHEDPEKYFRYHREMTKAGIKVHTCILASGWKDCQEYDFRTSMSILKRLMEENPDTYFMPRIKINPPLTWQKKHPTELLVYENGPKTAEEISALVGTEQQNEIGDGRPGFLLTNQSLSSLEWQEDALKYLDTFLELLENSPYENRIVGYHIGYGRCGESHVWDDGDFGISERKHFYEFGIQQYKDSEILAEKWQMETVNAYNAPVLKKSADAEETNDLMEFFHGREKDTCYLDYYRYRREVAFQVIEKFAKLAKEKTGKVIGIFHGYILHAGAQMHGHTDLQEVLESPYMDFLCAPKSYYRNGLGEPGGYYAPPLSVNRMKMWMDEMDYPHEKGKTQDFIKILWREFAKNQSVGSPFWWMDLSGSWYDSKTVQSTVSDLLKIKRKMGCKRQSIAEILLVVDENSSMFTMQEATFQMKTMQESQAQTALSGMPYDMYRMSDLGEISLEQYKVIYFLNCFQRTEKQKREFDEKLPKGCTVIYNYAFGIKNQEVTLENVQRNTGFTLKERKEQTSIPYLEVEETENVRAVFRFYEVKEAEKNNQNCAWKDIPEVDAVAVAELTRADGGLNVMAAIPCISSSYMRKLAVEAGCRIYAPENTVVYADDRFLSIFAYDSIQETIRLDGKYCEAVSEKEHEDSMKLEMEKGDFIFLLKK